MKCIVTTAFAFTILASTALAGPPLICETFNIGKDASLPWSANKDAWEAVDPNYKTANLATDTLKLLDTGLPLMARMETLRRATVYSSHDPAVGLELGTRLLARALAAEVRGQASSQPLFDAGYFVESMRQIAHIYGARPISDVDGYDLVRRSLPGLEDKLTAEFAMGLMQSDKAWPNEHIRLAVAGAQEGSLLAQNIVKHFRRQGFTEVKKQLAD
jgi:hypothetical protein